MELSTISLQKDMEFYFAEDDLNRNLYYLNQLPTDPVDCNIFIKSDLVLSGLPWFLAAFSYLKCQELEHFNWREFEGKSLKKGAVIPLGTIPFASALTGERIALNLLQRASNISTFTQKFVEKAQKYKIEILDTRKTTPGLRALEKYAVRVGGGKNHRLGQTDMWMIKDNHKTFFGGIKKSLEFFNSMGNFYNPIELEVHNESELEEALSLGVRHIMLDNFSPELIRKVVGKKPPGVTFEVSGGITLDKLEDYLITGIDAISVGSLTYAAPAVDISFKYQKRK